MAKKVLVKYEIDYLNYQLPFSSSLSSFHLKLKSMLSKDV